MFTTCGNLRVARPLALAFLTAALIAPRVGMGKPPLPKASHFAIHDVRLLPGRFKDAQDLDLEYLLALEPDRLLGFMREAAGLPRKGPPYGGWERGCSGMIGHYLSALSNMWAATGDGQLVARIEYILDEMALYQNTQEDAALYATSWERNHWFRLLGEGQFDEGGRVVPFYVMHKVLCGLRDAWKVAGSKKARDMLVNFVDRIDTLTAKLTDAQWKAMTSKEFGAPAESITDVYAFTRDPRHLALAKRFSRIDELNALATGDDRILYKRHANTIVPVFSGYQKVWEMGGGEKWGRAARNFWDKVLEHQVFVFGGHSIWEDFINPAEFNEKIVEVCGSETCNTYNLLKLTQRLYRYDPQVRYPDFEELALFNQILPSQGPAPEGGFVYYTATRPGHYRRYSQPYDAFWCCVGTGMENHGRYGQFIYAKAPHRLIVNQFIASTLDWKDEDVKVRQVTDFPETPGTSLSFDMAEPKTFTVSVRVPNWMQQGKLKAQVNGWALDVATPPGNYLDIRRTWKPGDRLDILTPLRVTEQLSPQGGRYASFLYGPIVLAAPLGDMGLKKSDYYADGYSDFAQLGRMAVEESAVPRIAGKPGRLASRLKRDDPSKLRFRTNGVGLPKDFDLVPFYEIGRQRYSFYFPLERR